MAFYTSMLNQAKQQQASSRDAEVQRQLSNWQNFDGWRSLTGFSRDRLAGADRNMAGSRNQFMGAITNMEGFDPGSYAQTQAGSMFRGLSRDFNAAEGQRRAALNRRGMLGSNVGGRAAETRFHDALANALAGLSMQTAGMRQQQLGDVAGMRGNVFGMDTDRSNMFTDMLYGSAASRISNEEAKRQADKERKSRLWGGLISAVGNVGGAYAGRGG